MTAQRIQRKRVKGWRMPENAVYVGRPSKWGNDFISGVRPLNAESRAKALALFKDMLQRAPDRPTLFAQIRRDLGGKDLACWCPLDEPCHADVLLKIANGGDAA